MNIGLDSLALGETKSKKKEELQDGPLDDIEDPPKSIGKIIDDDNDYGIESTVIPM